MAKIERTVEPWTNKEGQVIQPGDKVFAFTRCTGYLRIRIGTYLGVRKNTGYQGIRVQVAIQDEKSVAYLKDSDVPYNWEPYYKGKVSSLCIPLAYIYPNDLVYRTEPYTRITTLLENRIYPFEGMTAEKLASLV